MSNFYIAILILVSTVVMPAVGFAGAPPPQKAIDAAMQGVHDFLVSGDATTLQTVGFNSKHEAENAVLGEAFEVFTIPSGGLSDLASHDLRSLLVAKNEWIFLVKVDGQPRTTVVVKLVDGNWVPLWAGAKGLGKVLGDLANAWSASSGYRYKYVHVPDMKAGFVSLENGDDVMGFVPSNSLLAKMTGKRPEKYDPRKLIDEQTVMSVIAAVAKEKSNVQ